MDGMINKIPTEGLSSEKREWHQPKFQLLDARATAADVGSADTLAWDPQHEGDLGPAPSEGPGVFDPFGQGIELNADFVS